MCDTLHQHLLSNTNCRLHLKSTLWELPQLQLQEKSVESFLGYSNVQSNLRTTKLD